VDKNQTDKNPLSQVGIFCSRLYYSSPEEMNAYFKIRGWDLEVNQIYRD
jgi:hypothetical protein